MGRLARLADSMMDYGRAKEAFRLFREKHRQVVMYAMLLAVDDSDIVRKKAEIARQMILEKEVSRLGTLIRIDQQGRDFTPLILSHNVYAVEDFGDLLYDSAHLLIELGVRIQDSQLDEYMDRQLVENRLYLLEGKNPDLEGLKTKYMKQVLRKRS